MEKINIHQKLDVITNHWDPHIVAELNGQHVKLAKIKGEFIWHAHEKEDEMFLVIKGILLMHLRDRTITVNENEFIVIPKGIEHKPEAMEEVHLLLFEPCGTVNTGEIINEMTRKDLKDLRL